MFFLIFIDDDLIAHIGVDQLPYFKCIVQPLLNMYLYGVHA